MPLDTSIYSLAHLRLDGRRWHELRHVHAQTSISNVTSSTTGSSYLEMGGTKVLCTVSGPFESDRRKGGGGSGGRGEAQIQVDVNIAGFSGTDRRRAITGGSGGNRGGDKRTTELSHALSTTLSTALLTHLYPSSTIALVIHVLAQDGSLLATCLNAATLALVDAGVPMTGYVVGCTVGVVGGGGGGMGDTPDVDIDAAEPVLDVNALEEQELPFLTLATGGGVNLSSGERKEDDMFTAGVGVARSSANASSNAKISLLMLETRIPADKLEDMLSVGVEGCERLRRVLDTVVRAS